MRGPAALLISSLGVGLVPGCSVFLDSSTQQCSSDSECAPVKAVCDRGSGLCVFPAPKVTWSTSSGSDAGGDAVADASFAGDGADPFALWPCARGNKPIEPLTGDISSSRRLTCEKDYLLVGPVAVKAGAVLTIDPGTTVLGDVASKGRLAVERGARLVADGLRMAPIVFTSAASPPMRRAGDWAGIVLLGRAPSATTAIDAVGLRPGDELGGSSENDNSGVLRFVRVEYAGASAGNSTGAGAVTLGGVGTGTVLNNVQVRQSGQDCFKFIGGSVGGKHLVCQGSLRNGFDWESGYRGKLQFLVVQQTPRAVDGSNGLSVRNGVPGAGDLPVTEPQIYNATLCGRSVDVPGEQYGMLVAAGARLHVANALVAGFDAGIDVRGPTSAVDVRNSQFWLPIAYPEDGSNATDQADDDGGFDESKQFLEPARRNALGRPSFGDCFEANRIGFAPSPAMRTDASKPPDDGFFDPQAAYLGAIRDQSDDWLSGEWVQWRDH